MPPMTRNRSYNNTPQPHAIEYYAQRATKGGFLISESASASDISQGSPNMPGIWTEDQKEAWKPIVDSVHSKGGIFFCQIWHPGRISNSRLNNWWFLWTNAAGELKSVSELNIHNIYMSITYRVYLMLKPSCYVIHASNINRVFKKKCNVYNIVYLLSSVYICVAPHDGACVEPTLRQLSTCELAHIVDDFRIAARNAIEAGFDGVEINSANSYIIEQFFNDQVNDRSDEYGGSIENRCRFALEVIGAIVNEIGGDRVGIKLGKKDSNPEALLTYLASQLTKLGVLYLHVFEPRDEPRNNCLQFIRKSFEGTLIASGGYNKNEGDVAISENCADLVSFGRLFLANPDLPKRFEVNGPLNKHDRSTFYKNDPIVGYTDYPSLQLEFA
uniref:12-oxophytodienoate reductase n=1 Tax=Solanum tuberosum TaxID=4113 RepID=M1BYD2_SOLTU